MLVAKNTKSQLWYKVRSGIEFPGVTGNDGNSYTKQSVEYLVLCSVEDNNHNIRITKILEIYIFWDKSVEEVNTCFESR